MTNVRLTSLDLLRGADIFLLTVVCTLVHAIHRVWPWPAGFIDQFRHPAWTGFSLHDLIMPLFIFMSGAALPLALPKRLDENGRAGGRYWRHVLGRVALLWLLGMVVQGELLSFDLRRISFFNNTLQAIACGYLITALAMLIRNVWLRRVVPFVLAFAYTLFLHGCGDMTPTGNAAVVWETRLLLIFYPDATWHPVRQIVEWGYSWWMTIPMFGFMALAGAETTEIIRRKIPAERKFLCLSVLGGGLLTLGGLIALFDPVVKRIFTASFTFLATGASVLLYTLFFLLFDVCGIRRGTGLLALFGRHSLMAYLLIESTFRSVLWTASAVFLGGPCRTMDDGVLRFLDSRPAKELAMHIGLSVLLCLVLWFWDRLFCPPFARRNML
ncbi:MAG: hypothetical protein ACI4R9_09215 [Kiritimatiellia bacterium]